MWGNEFISTLNLRSVHPGFSDVLHGWINNLIRTRPQNILILLQMEPKTLKRAHLNVFQVPEWG